MSEDRTICCMICGEPLGYLLKEGPLPRAVCSGCRPFIYVAQEAEKE